MQSLQDLHLFDDDQNFQKQKEESTRTYKGSLHNESFI